jgi:hypothetical protein
LVLNRNIPMAVKIKIVHGKAPKTIQPRYGPEEFDKLHAALEDKGAFEDLFWLRHDEAQSHKILPLQISAFIEAQKPKQSRATDGPILQPVRFHVMPFGLTEKHYAGFERNGYHTQYMNPSTGNISGLVTLTHFSPRFLITQARRAQLEGRNRNYAFITFGMTQLINNRDLRVIREEPYPNGLSRSSQPFKDEVIRLMSPEMQKAVREKIVSIEIHSDELHGGPHGVHPMGRQRMVVVVSAPAEPTLLERWWEKAKPKKLFGRSPQRA